jgi:hypothetical protein
MYSIFSSFSANFSPRLININKLFQNCYRPDNSSQLNFLNFEPMLRYRKRRKENDENLFAIAKYFSTFSFPPHLVKH